MGDPTGRLIDCWGTLLEGINIVLLGPRHDMDSCLGV
jgi:hypothetical protein